MKEKKNYRVALCAVLCAQAIALNFLESLLPEMPFLPPGAKPGFANITVMFACSHLGLPFALTITAVKSAFVFATRGATAFIMSISGGLLSCLAAYFLLKYKGGKLGYIGISVVCALCHNAGQLAACVFITGSRSTLYYAPFLIIMSIIAGVLTGLIYRAVLPALSKLRNNPD